MPRGRGVRCYGYLDPAGEYARCTREDVAGSLPGNQDGTYSHRLQGACRCGEQHGAPGAFNRPLAMPRPGRPSVPSGGLARNGGDGAGTAAHAGSATEPIANGTWTADQYRERTGLLLLPQHHAQLVASGISLEVAAERGYRSAATKTELANLGLGPAQRAAPALVLPLWSVEGEVAFSQVRPDQPRLADGKPVKYETPRGTRGRLDVHPRARAQLGDPKLPLLITEGLKKADAAISAGLCCAALLGVANWRGANQDGGVTALADWELVALRGRRVVIVFDSDVMAKSEVHQQLVRLRRFLEQKGAEVRVVYLPSGDGGSKVGLDDFLAAGRSRDELLALAEDELRRPEHQEPGEREWQAHGYTMNPRGIFREARKLDEPPCQVTDFACRIQRKVILDDGAETRLRYELQLQQGKRLASVAVPAEKFESLIWLRQVHDLDLWVAAGPGSRDQARAAIDLFSKQVERKVVYTHTGWRELEDGRWVYLHAGGAIGAEGTIDQAEVELSPALRHYELPPPPQGSDLREAVLASLSIADLAPRVAYPTLAFAYRAVLGPLDFVLQLFNRSGFGKSELAALAQQHWGPAMDRKHLPAHLDSDSVNYLRGLAFQTKDALLVADNFKPLGSRFERQRKQMEANQLISAIGDHAGRGRADVTGAPRAPQEPRGSVIITAEEAVDGYSAAARSVVIEVGAGEVDGLGLRPGQPGYRTEHPRLTALQEMGARGLYAQAMAGYARWLASRIEDLKGWARHRVRELRPHLAGEHARTASNLAELVAGMELFTRFALEVGAIDERARRGWLEGGWRALRDIARGQQAQEQEMKPERRFLELLASAIGTGRAHLANPKGGRPENPGAWGWREHQSGLGFGIEGCTPPTTSMNEVPRWDPQGLRVGWVDSPDLFLWPAPSMRVADEMDPERGVGVSQVTLGKRLRDAGLLASVRDNRNKGLTVQRRLTGADSPRPCVWHLRTRAMDEDGDDPRSGPGPPGRDPPAAPAPS